MPHSGYHAVLDLLRIHLSTEADGGHSPACFSVAALPSASRAKGTRSVTAHGHPHPARTTGAAVIHISSCQTCLCQHYDTVPEALGCNQAGCRMRSCISHCPQHLLFPPDLFPISRVLLAWKSPGHPPTLNFG